MVDPLKNSVASGLYLEDDFLSAEECACMLDAIAEYREQNEATEVYRNYHSRPLNYSVIDGIAIGRKLPVVAGLLPKVNALVNKLCGENLEPLSNERVACNINITGMGGTYRWHYDRNRITAILFLNEVSGGETECFPNYRIAVAASYTSRLQQLADNLLQAGWVRHLFGRKFVCAPKRGRLLVMRGDRCLHSVRPVTSDTERINVILSFDRPGADFAVQDGLDAYLYEPEAKADGSRDPNYVTR